MSDITLGKITAVAGTAGLLFAADGRAGARVQNPFSVPIWLNHDNNPAMAFPSVCVPAASALGPGEYCFDWPPTDAWYYKTTSAGDFGVQVWF